MPSSKSHSIRALLIAGAADGTSTIENLLDIADTASCITALRTLGVTVSVLSRSETGMTVKVTPPPGGMLTPTPPAGRAATDPAIPTAATRPVTIDVGNSGTTLYLLTAMSAIRPGGVCFDGDESIRLRSAALLLNAVQDLGGTVHSGTIGTTDTTGTPGPRSDGCAPYCVEGPLKPGRSITIESPTSQYLSALLLAAPLIPNTPIPAAPPAAPPTPTHIHVVLLNEHPYVDMTCWWLDQQNITYHRHGYDDFTIPPGQHYRPLSVQLPGDYSSATFWFTAAAITGTPITVDGLAPDDVQGDKAVLDILQHLGCTVSWSTTGTAAVTVSGTPRRGGTFDLNAMPDALPALTTLACFAPEAVTLTNVPQARQKETDRIAVMTRELRKLGAVITEFPDGLKVEPKVLHSGTVDSHGDHRIAMALAVGALGATGPVTITGADAAEVTYPAFYTHLRALAPQAVPAPPTGENS